VVPERVCGVVTMHTGERVAQLIDPLPPMVFERCVARYGGNQKVKSFPCMDQCLRMAFAWLTLRENLRDTEARQNSQAERGYHMGIRGWISRNILGIVKATHLPPKAAIAACFSTMDRCHVHPFRMRTRAAPKPTWVVAVAEGLKCRANGDLRSLQRA